MDFLELSQDRFSCRKFSNKIVEQEKVDKIVKSAMLAPTAVNKQPFKIFQINTKENIEKLKKVTPYTFNANLFFIVGADNNEAYNRNLDNKNFSEIDAAIVATHMMLEIQDLSLGTTWVGYFDENKLKLEFPQINNYSVVAIFPVGYPSDDVQISPMHYKSKEINELLEVIE